MDALKEKSQQVWSAGGDRKPWEDGVGMAITAGLTPGANLRKNRIFRLTPRGVEFAGEMSLDQWQRAMVMLRMARTSWQVWLADFLDEGRRRFGDTVVQETLVQLEFAEMDVHQAMGIAGLAEGAREAALSSEHLWVLARAELSREKQSQWALLAVEHGLSALQLSRSIEMGKVTKETRASSGGGLPTFQGFRQMFDTVWRRVEKNDPIEQWEEERLRSLWDELKGPVKVGLDVARKLGIDVEGRETGGR